MPARIFCKVGELKGVGAEIGEEATLGRSRSATVRLETELVSGEHARLSYRRDEECYVLEDLGSTNGTALDGVRIREPERLGHLHVITLAGEYDFIFQDLERCARRHEKTLPSAHAVREEPVASEVFSEETFVDEQPPVLPAGIPVPEGTQIDDVERTSIEEVPILMPDRLAQKAEALGPQATTVRGREEIPTVEIDPDDVEPPEADRERALTEDQLAGLLLGEDEGPRVFGLEIETSEDTVDRFRLRDGENLLGRGEDSQIWIDSLEISRRHAAVTVSAGKVTIRDLGSSNHTYVEGERIGDDVEIEAGTKLKFGRIEARLIPWKEG